MGYSICKPVVLEAGDMPMAIVLWMTPLILVESSFNAIFHVTQKKNSSEAAPAATEESDENPEAATEASSENFEEGNAGDQDAAEETPEIKLETAPVDFRFPTTNQTRCCFTRYVEYHRCTAAEGEGAPECENFAKYYRALCPGEWIDRWNENGTFPGPL
ncbi:Cytochrome c oxidase subunit 6b-1 [Morella rubra]|uniref:Cytochrome c oxidase subunit 6b-1 n=1 Tax=Morella rubra TaxID=262757 RepID=A0A6A1WF11_9ROSI|nr:Cytochrome c oxidase subunit 6b-1 [Morella rubra]